MIRTLNVNWCWNWTKNSTISFLWLWFCDKSLRNSLIKNLKTIWVSAKRAALSLTESGSGAALLKNGQSGSGNGAPKFQSERERERRSVKVGSGKQSASDLIWNRRYWISKTCKISSSWIASFLGLFISTCVTIYVQHCTYKQGWFINWH